VSDPFVFDVHFAAIFNYEEPPILLSGRPCPAGSGAISEYPWGSKLLANTILSAMLAL